MNPVVELSRDEILPLRVEVLRKGTPTRTCDYAEDNYADAKHFGIVRDGVVVGTSTWFAKECPERVGLAAVQLKGMATSEALHGEGLGTLLIDRGIEYACSLGAEVVWARARDSALGFYLKCGFEVIGDGFIDEPTAMPHHIVIREI